MLPTNPVPSPYPSPLRFGSIPPMSLLQASGLAQRQGSEIIFQEVNCAIPQDARIALVGPNGAGKSSLLRILSGEDEPIIGQIQRARQLQIGYLPQVVSPDQRQHSLYQEQLRAFPDLRRWQGELRDLERELSRNKPADADLLQRYEATSVAFETAGGYQYEHEIRRVLSGLGFAPADEDRPLAQFSGGQQTRAALARLLLAAPTLLLLDEPTHHLDIAALDWLESYLTNYERAVLIVSHDRHFIDAFAREIWELEGGTLTRYRGNFSQYQAQRAERQLRQEKEHSRQQMFLQQEQEFIRKHLGSRLTTQARGRQKRLQSLAQRGGIIHAPKKQRRPRFSFAEADRSGDEVLVTQQLTVGYDESNPLLSVPDVTLRRGETVAILGANGSGKTTLLRTLTSEIPPLRGAFRFGTGCRIGYLEQARATLHEEDSLLEMLLASQAMTLSRARDELGRFGFSGDDAFRTVATLSGGERSRFALALLAQTAANCWLLDEPTHHLDLPNQAHLQRALEHFSGTTLLVSHDRYLIAALATQIWQVAGGEIHPFQGSYAEFTAAQQDHLHRSRKETTKRSPSPADPHTDDLPKPPKLTAYQRRKRQQELEILIQQLEGQLAQLEEQLAAASTAGAVALVRELGEQHGGQAQALEQALQEWQEISE